MKEKLALFLPGIFLLGFNIGTGSVTTMATAGANYGMSLLWTVLISCAATYLMIANYGRYTLVTGETALEAFRKHIHPAVGVFFILALGVGVCGSVMGVMGIVAEISYEWSKTIIEGGIAPIYWAAFFCAIAYFIFWSGRTQVFERALAVIVAIMAACFVLNFFILMPPVVDMAAGLVPSVPEVSSSETGPLLLIASMVGTTIFSGLFIIRTTLVKEAGWTIEHDKQQRRDAAFAAIMMFVISASIMAAAAGSLFAEGIGLDSASQMIGLLEPLAGALAVSIFAIGIIAAGVSSQFPNLLMIPWLLCDFRGTPRDMTLWKYRVFVFAISLLGLVVPLFDARPVFVLILSQAFNVVLLPVTVGCIIYLGNRADLMGAYRNSLLTNAGLAGLFLFSLLTGYMGFLGLRDMLAG
ncbi:Nramp family divalent metal transporter [Parasphingorhabdus halotolerans]|uniref:Nramp family divalent metal transporter n=1 Tax=Parasphingorhabdus halotolerans TaxID=2725558 RepID=A0A6H2DNE8_9SPHN|nr:Nramp family divalent metal transporter [Parasphingorhabdus halotolerans]QJB70192.1 Nramp family divalent metal transporter [Parasphingorhabdus halotolerans]